MTEEMIEQPAPPTVARSATSAIATVVAGAATGNDTFFQRLVTMVSTARLGPAEVIDNRG
jgi:hypothetical protein